MKIMLTILGLFLLMVTFGVAQQQQHGSEPCGFAVQGEPAHPTVTGPEDILPLVYVVEQPDSPIEVVSVDLTGMWLSVANEQHTERNCATYKVRNRSDRPVQAFDVQLSVSVFHGGGDLERIHRLRWPLAKLSRLSLAAVAAVAEHLKIT